MIIKKTTKILAGLAIISAVNPIMANASAYWSKSDNNWFYIENGMKRTGWLNDNGSWYYLESDGSMAKDCWRYDMGNWYYFYSNGSMAHNTTIDGYYVNSKGAWVASGLRTGPELMPKLREIGLTNSRVSHVLRYNPYGEKGLDVFTGFNYTAQPSGEFDITIAIDRNIAESDMKLKQTFNVILPTKGNELFSILDAPGLKSQTLYMDGRTVKINLTNHGITLGFSPIQ